VLTGQDNKRRILAVDDTPDITLTLKAGLEASGSFEVHTFNDPEVALSNFKPGIYDFMSTKEDKNGEESKEPDYDDDKDHLQEVQEEETGELKEETTTKIMFFELTQYNIYSIKIFRCLM